MKITDVHKCHRPRRKRTTRSQTYTRIIGVHKGSTHLQNSQTFEKITDFHKDHRRLFLKKKKKTKQTTKLPKTTTTKPAGCPQRTVYVHKSHRAPQNSRTITKITNVCQDHYSQRFQTSTWQQTEEKKTHKRNEMEQYLKPTKITDVHEGCRRPQINSHPHRQQTSTKVTDAHKGKR